MGQEAEAQAAHDGGHQRAAAVMGQQPGLEQAIAVEEERAGGDGDGARGQPVEAVDQVDGVGDQGHPHHGDQRAEIGREDDEARERDAEVEHRHAEPVEDAGGENLPGQLRRRRHLPQVVDDAHHEDHRGGQHDPQRLRRAVEEVVAELRDDRRHRHAREEPDVHGHAAEGGQGLRVHSPLPRLHHGADPHRQ